MNSQNIVVAILCLIVVGFMACFRITYYLAAREKGPKPFGRDKRLDQEVQDPEVEPKGYEPPKTAEELLSRYAAGHRYFVGTDLTGFDLSGANLSNINLSGAKAGRLVVKAENEPPLVGMKLEGTPPGGTELIHTIGEALEASPLALDDRPQVEAEGEEPDIPRPAVSPEA